MAEIKKQKSKIDEILEVATWAAYICTALSLTPVLLDYKMVEIPKPLYNAALNVFSVSGGALPSLYFARLAIFLTNFSDKRERSNKLKCFLQSKGFDDKSFSIPLQEACTKFYDEILITFYSATLIKDKFNSTFWKGSQLKSISDLNNPTMVGLLIDHMKDEKRSKDKYFIKLIQLAKVLLGENFEIFYNDLSKYCSNADIILPIKDTNQKIEIDYLV